MFNFCKTSGCMKRPGQTLGDVTRRFSTERSQTLVFLRPEKRAADGSERTSVTVLVHGGRAVSDWLRAPGCSAAPKKRFWTISDISRENKSVINLSKKKSFTYLF